jgi:Gas vesicle protein G
VIILDSLLVGGLRFVLDKVVTAVEAEMNDEGALKEELLAAQMRLELGEIGDEEFAAIEDDVLMRLRDIRDREREGPAGAMSMEPGGGVSVEVEFGGDEREDRGERYEREDFDR